MKVPALGNVVQTGVIRPGKSGRFADQLDATITMDGRPPIRTTMVAFKPAKTEQRLFRTNLPREQFEFVRTARTVSIQAGRELDETLALTQMDPVLRILGNCVADLRTVWNVTEGEATPPPLKQGATGISRG